MTTAEHLEREVEINYEYPEREHKGACIVVMDVLSSIESEDQNGRNRKKTTEYIKESQRARNWFMLFYDGRKHMM